MRQHMLSHDSTYQQTLKAKLANSVKLIQATTVKPLPPPISSNTTSMASMLTSTPMPPQLNNMIILNASGANSPNINASNLFANFLASASNSPSSNVASFMTNSLQQQQQQQSNQIASLGGVFNSPTSTPIIIKYTPNTSNTNMGNLMNNNHVNINNGQRIFLTTNNNLPFQSQFGQNQFQIISSPTGTSVAPFSNLTPTNNIIISNNSINNNNNNTSINVNVNAEPTANTGRKQRQKKQPEQPAPQLPPNFSNSKKFKISSIFKPLITKDNHPCLIPSPPSPPPPPSSSSSNILTSTAKASVNKKIADDATIIKETVETIIDKIILDFAREERRERDEKALANKQLAKLASKNSSVTSDNQKINDSILSVINEKINPKNSAASVKKVHQANKNNCLAHEKQFVAGKRKKMIQVTENSFVIMNKETKEDEKNRKEEEKEKEQNNKPAKRIRLNEDEEKDVDDDNDEDVVNQIINSSSVMTSSEDSSCSQSIPVNGDTSTSATTVTGRVSTCTFCQKLFTNTSNFVKNKIFF